MKDPPVTDARMAAAHGYAVARFWPGLCYASGSGVPRDAARDGKNAMKGFRTAAEQGYAAAAAQLRARERQTPPSDGSGYAGHVSARATTRAAQGEERPVRSPTSQGFSP